MLAIKVNQNESLNYPDNHIQNILHGPKNVFIKQRYLNSKRDYQSYFLINTGKEIVNSCTILYNSAPALRRFYFGIPPFVTADLNREKIEEFRTYLAALNQDVIDFLNQKLTILNEPDNPLALYIIPELISNAVKSNHIIEKQLNSGNRNPDKIINCMIEVVCLVNRKKPDHIDVIIRNYAPYLEEIEKKIETGLNCHWTKRIKFKKEKTHRENCESSEYGLPSINYAIRKHYNGELIYDGYDDSFSDYGAYQFIMRLPKNEAGVK